MEKLITLVLAFILSISLNAQSISFGCKEFVFCITKPYQDEIQDKDCKPIKTPAIITINKEETIITLTYQGVTVTYFVKKRTIEGQTYSYDVKTDDLECYIVAP